ncbi:hypothetical protein [Flectobacillus major]|uniref:hypothetical protein n=1 Tax=Flectobacillus major TaxID=103 RepID=UPI00047ABBD3|nr:hypothetical protein [Flectobacillus major]
MKKLETLNIEHLHGGSDRCSLVMGMVVGSAGIILANSWNPIGWALGGVVGTVGLAGAYFCK